MTAQDILDGKMIVEIGMAAVRPAEFIILRFMHKMQEIINNGSECKERRQATSCNEQGTTN
jgi:phage tail sheath protein FI